MKKHIIIALAQLAFCAAILFLPSLAVWMSTGDKESAGFMLTAVRSQFIFPFVLFFLNYYVLVPWLLERHRRPWTFAGVNLLLNIALNHSLLFLNVTAWGIPDKRGVLVIYSGLFLYAMFCFAAIIIAVAMRNFQRTKQLRRKLQGQQQRMTEAELSWLKNQLNPHFLFNTLNNISSLTALDPERAQDSLSQLSELLRYALYETGKNTVPLDRELDFMRNYIDLMSLRCGDNVDIRVDLPDAPSSHEVAPLLFLGPIENAFKHGVSATHPSRVHIYMTETDGTLTFRAENTNFPKTSKRSGTGIGTENLRRRLQLLYPGRHTLTLALDGDIYSVTITLKL